MSAASFAIILADGSHLTGWTDIEVDELAGEWLVFAIDATGDRREVKRYTLERAAREARWHLLTRREMVRHG